MAKKIFKWILVLLGIGLLIFIGYILMIVSAFGGFDKDYSVSELKENFNANKKEIYELKRYFNKIVPKNRFVEIEFEDDNTLFRFGIDPLDSTAGNPNGPMFLEWDLKINNLQMEKIIKPLGWTSETLKVLKYKLDKLLDTFEISSKTFERVSSNSGRNSVSSSTKIKVSALINLTIVLASNADFSAILNRCGSIVLGNLER